MYITHTVSKHIKYSCSLSSFLYVSTVPHTILCNKMSLCELMGSVGALSSLDEPDILLCICQQNRHKYSCRKRVETG